MEYTAPYVEEKWNLCKVTVAGDFSHRKTFTLVSQDGCVLLRGGKATDAQMAFLSLSGAFSLKDLFF